MAYGILKGSLAGANKCPKCCRISVPFLVVGDGLLGCRDCGCVFIRKECRSEVVVVSVVEEKVPEAQVVVGGEGAEVGSPVVEDKDSSAVTHVCDICGKSCKNAMGLASHKKSHVRVA